MKDNVRSRVIPQTSLIELSITWREPNDATAVCRLITAKYMQKIKERGDERGQDRIKQLSDTIEKYTNDLKNWQGKKESLIRDQKLDSLSDRASQKYAQMQGINEELQLKSQELLGIQKQLEGMRETLNSPAGFVLPDEMAQEAERDPQVQEARGRVQMLDNEQQALMNRGLPPEHTQRRQIRAQLSAAQALLTDTTNRVGRKLFDGKVDQFATAEKSRLAQIADLQSQKQNLSVEMTDLTRFQAQLDDMQRQIETLMDLKSRATSEKERAVQLAGTKTSSRVIIQQNPRPPSQMTFPQIKLMVPAGVMLMLMLVGGTVVVRELVDQRVKSPADIGLIPRTRLLGWIPDAAEDPAGEGAAETAFRDRSRGVLAESFRQMRSVLAKRIQQAGHKTVVVMAGLPGSGATTIVSNLAMACAASEMRVLVIDANFRRPAIHRVFGIQEAPGLADVLARTSTLDACVQQTTTQNLDVLSVGTRDQRILERLSNDVMSETLQLARVKYDLVLIDIAPAVVAGDGIAVANRCDASILVARAFGEKRGMVARIKNDLGESKSEFLGVIVNAVRAASGGYMKGNIKVAHEYQQA
jgi:capsular exopolysaccharide synthesis family protein